MASTDSQTKITKWTPEKGQGSLQNLSHKRWRLSLLLGVFLASGGGVMLWYWLQSQHSPPQALIVREGPPPRPVETVSLKAGQGVQRVQLLGEISASQSATLRSQTSGAVQKLFVSEGDRVKAGQIIAILDSVEQQLALAQAQARLAAAKSNLANLERGTRSEVLVQRRAALQSAKAQESQAVDNLRRTQALAKEGALSTRSLVEAQAAANTATGNRLSAAAELAEAMAGPLPEEIEAQKANVAAAQAAVNQAKLTLQRTKVQAVSDGIVRTRDVSVGDYVESADPIVTLVDSNVVDVFLEVPEELTGQISPDLPVNLRSRALPNWQRSASITGIVPVADNQSRRQLVRVRLNNPPSSLLPGMAIQADLSLRPSQQGFVISRDALTRRADQWLVFSVDKGKAKKIEVELVSDMGETVLIRSTQLQPNASIVLKGGDSLRQGVPVKVVNVQTPQV